ncbi:MAG: CCA tRNA nucleotidyltransferase, partial [Rhodospirillales bacterium]|nr:CCA tRNA nucleotidyltransferase [Rhodospirillales bacterium]
MAPRLKELSAERIAGELLRILLTADPAGVIHLMQGERVLEHILPEAGDVGRLRVLAWLETTAIRVETVKPDFIRRLAALVRTDADGAGEIADRLRLSNRQKTRLMALCEPPFQMSSDLGEYEI